MHRLTNMSLVYIINILNIKSSIRKTELAPQIGLRNYLPIPDYRKTLELNYENVIVY